MALGLGVPPQNTMLSGMVGLGMVQQNPLDSLFGSMGTNAMTGLGGLNGASLQSANSGNDLHQLAALLGGSQQQNVTFQHQTPNTKGMLSVPTSTIAPLEPSRADEHISQ